MYYNVSYIYYITTKDYKNTLYYNTIYSYYNTEYHYTLDKIHHKSHPAYSI